MLLLPYLKEGVSEAWILMDTLTSNYLDILEVQEKATTMYRELLQDLSEFQQNLNVLKVLQKYGYHKSTIASLGEESFHQMLRIHPDELSGKSPSAKRNIYVANLGTWLKQKLGTIVTAIRKFITWVIDRITAWIYKSGSPNPTVGSILSISSFDPTLMVAGVMDYKEFLSKVGSLKQIVVYLQSWYFSLANAFNMCRTLPTDATPAAIVIDRQLSSADGAIAMFDREVKHNHYGDGYVTNRNGGQFILPVASQDPISLVEMGWNGGTTIRFAKSELAELLKNSRTLVEKMNVLNGVLAKIDGEIKSQTLVFTDQNVQSAIADIVPRLITITGYILKCTTVIGNSSEMINTQFDTMCVNILTALKNKR